MRSVVKHRLAVTFALVIVAFGLLSIGSMLLDQSAKWTVEYNYEVSIIAPDDVNWTLYLPRPEKAMSISTNGSQISVSDVQTAHGLMYNVTGRGNAGIDQSLIEIVYDPGNGQQFIPEDINLSGFNVTGFWVWRGSDHASSTIHVDGKAPYSATQMGGWTHCGGLGYDDVVPEGWSVAGLQAGDCDSGFDSLNAKAYALMAFAATGIAAAGAVVAFIWARGEKRNRANGDSQGP